MNWKLWLDDQIHDLATPDRHAPAGWIGAASTEEAKQLVITHGLPWSMDLDHDLGGDDRTMDFLKWLSETHPDGPAPLTSVHSRNPEGAKNILSFVNSWRRSLAKDDSPLKVLSVHFGSPVAAVWTIDPGQQDKFTVFMNEHDALHKGSDGAIGGRYTYEFTDTSLGRITVLRCACGARCDASDYQDW